MPDSTGYLRHPSICGEVVTFVTEDDLWSVPAGGGVARRLTANLSEVSHPVLSPDGLWVAFTSRDEHHPEVYAMPADGGPARRLTWLGASSLVRGWTPDGRILFVSDAATPFHHIIRPYAIDPAGGAPELLPYGPAREVAFGPVVARANGREDGAASAAPGGGVGAPASTAMSRQAKSRRDGHMVVLGRNTADPARWKRYRGGTAGELWIDRRGNGDFRRLLHLKGNLASPMIIGDRVWFLSDHEGIGNLYSCRPDGRDVQRHTDHAEYYARFAKTDGRRIVYQHAADLHVFDPRTDRGRRMGIDLHSPRVQRNRKFVAADRHLHGFALHPNGHSLVLQARGKLFTMPLWEQAVRQHGRPDGVRYRHAAWMGDGSALVVVSDEGGEDAIEVLHPGDTANPPRRLQSLDLGCITNLATPPEGHQVAVANHRHELFLVDLEADAARLLDRSLHGHLAGVVWSPDGRWLAYSFGSSAKTTSIKICELETGATHLVTRPEFKDVHPSWDPEGRFLYFLSYRVFDPVYDALYFDLGFPKAVRPYLVTLSADEPSPFVPKPRGFGPKSDTARDTKPAPKTTPEEATESAPAGEEPREKQEGRKPVRIDLEGIAGRLVPVPVPEGRYSQVVGLKNKILLTSWPVEGSLGRDIMSTGAGVPKGTLEGYDLGEQRHEVLVPGISYFEISRDGHTLAYRSGRRLRVLRAGEKPPDSDDGPGRRSGWLDLDRIRVSVDPGSEWAQMFQEAWRLQRDHFWVEDMSGVDWNHVRRRYAPLVDRVATRAEFSDLMWEMQGELGTSHAYELGGDYRPAPNYVLGQLGADLYWDPGASPAGAWRFGHIVEGAGWEPDGSSPLRAPGVRVTEGMRLLAVNGQAVGEQVSPRSLLVNQAGLAVELTVAGAEGVGVRDVVVTTLRDERPARYREWVARNRAAVHDASGGRVGYVHVPDMGPRGYAEFHRSYLSEVERDALVVDVRYNGGGHVSQLVLEKLARRRIGYDVSRWGVPDPYPADSPAGPLVALTNEFAGSDGDIFTHCFKLLGLGPVVGKRTWGGVIGIWPRHALVDGSLTTQPEFAFWFTDVGWGVENYGTEPDVDIDIRPQDHVAGVDPQLDEAVRIAVEALGGHEPTRPDTGRRPQLPLPELPARKPPKSRTKSGK